MWIVLSAVWLLTFKEERITFSGTLFLWGFLFFLISLVFKKTNSSSPVLYVRCPQSLWEYSHFRQHCCRSLCLYQIIVTAFPSFFFLNHRKIYFAAHKKCSRTCARLLLSFIGTLAELCWVSHLGCGRQNSVWGTCWLWKLTSLIFLMLTSFPLKLLLEKVGTLVLACKPKWFPLCVFQHSPCLCEFFVQSFLSPELLLVRVWSIEITQALAIY